MKPKRPFIIGLFILSLNVLLFGAIFSALFVGSLALSLPEITGITEFNPPIPSLILSRNGNVLLEIGVEKRNLTPISDIPQKVIDTFIVAEDKNFYSHQGVDYWGILRATGANLKAGKVVQGGSTITQQVAKQLYLSGERSIARKIKDMLLALQLEKKFSKDEILYLYLNKVYLGGGYYGVTAAFRGYFEKELHEATVAECALIAGLLVAPAKYSPYVNPEYAKIRQNYVLTRLLDTNKITEEEYQKAKNEVLKFRIKKPQPLRGGHFTEWIRQRIEEKVGKESFGRDGFRVITTINWSQQEKAEKYIREGVKAIDKRQGYKGPLKYLQSEKAIRAFFAEQRQKIYRENSKHFLFKSASSAIAEAEYEFSFSEEELDQIEQYDQKILDLSKLYKIYPGNSQEVQDPFLNFIKKDETYEAVVLRTDDLHRLIYASIGGIKGIIPHDKFRWARERAISKERSYAPLVSRPSSILKRGDVILVKVIEQNKSIYQTMNIAAKKKLKDKRIIGEYQSQQFLELALEQESEVEASLVAIQPNSGEILSLVGGSNFIKSQFNRAIQSLRQPGSSFKPILYAAALENGFTPSDILIDSPEALGGVDQTLSWKPRNYDGTFKGPITFRRSLETSRNVPTIKLASRVGVQNIINFAKRIGIKANLASDLSLALGSTGMTLMNLTTTYAIFPNGGRKVFPKTILRITDRFGNEYPVEDFEPYKRPQIKEGTLESLEELSNAIADNLQNKKDDKKDSESQHNENNKESSENGDGKESEKKGEKTNEFLADLDDEYVYDQRLAFIMTNLLRGIIQNGTGREARYISSFIGGKTGTTNNYVDALFIGFSSNLALGVWTGFDNNKTLGWGETGAKAALPIWKKYMEDHLKKYGEYDFKIPNGLINVRITKETGRPAEPGDVNTIIETFVTGTEPGAKEEALSVENIENDLFDEGDYFNNQ